MKLLHGTENKSTINPPTSIIRVLHRAPSLPHLPQKQYDVIDLFSRLAFDGGRLSAGLILRPIISLPLSSPG